MAGGLTRKFARRFQLNPHDVFQDVALLIVRFTGPDAGQRPAHVDPAKWLYMKVWGALECRYTRAAVKAANVQGAARDKSRDRIDATDHADTVMIVQDVRAAVAKLPTSIRRAVELVALRGMTQAEAAEAIGISQNQVCKRLAAGETMLQELLAAYKDERP